MADSNLLQKRKYATMADFDVQDESTVLLTSPSVKDELPSDNHRNLFGKLSSHHRHTSTPKPNNRLYKALSNNRSPESPTNDLPSCTLRHSPKSSSVHSSGSPILGSPTSPVPSSTHTTSTAKLAALRAASAVSAASKQPTTNNITPSSAQPNGGFMFTSQHTRTAPSLRKGSHAPVVLSTTTAPTTPKRTLPYNDQERLTTSDVWAPLSSPSASQSPAWDRLAPWEYPFHFHKRMKVAGRGPVERSNALKKMIDRFDKMKEESQRRTQKVLEESMKELMQAQLEAQHERRDQDEQISKPQKQRYEDDGDRNGDPNSNRNGNPIGTQELEKQARERVGQVVNQQVQEQVQQQQQQQQQQRQDQDHPQEETSIPLAACPTTPQQTSMSGGIASSPQNALEVQEHTAVSLDRELLPRVRKVSVTTVVYELEPVST